LHADRAATIAFIAAEARIGDAIDKDGLQARMAFRDLSRIQIAADQHERPVAGLTTAEPEVASTWSRK
jgi:hypothetical protein